MKRFTLISICALYSYSVQAQQQNTFITQDSETKGPLAGVTISVKGNALVFISDSLGMATLTHVPAGRQTIVFSYIGYETKEQVFNFPFDKPMEVLLEPAESDLAEVQVTATRSSRSINDIPTRIETITAGELHEKAVMQPGNIRMLLTESTGI